MSRPDRQTHAAASAGGSAKFAAPDVQPHPLYDVHTLMQGGRRLVLSHGAEHYQLRITRSGKLILTK